MIGYFLRQKWIIAAFLVLGTVLILKFTPVYYYAVLKSTIARDRDSFYFVLAVNRNLEECLIESSENYEVNPYGYSLTVPYEIEREGISNSSAFYELRGKKGVILNHDNGTNGELEELRKINHMVFGPEAKSFYNLFEASLKTTPDHISIFDSRKELAKKATLTLLKGSFALNQDAYLASSGNVNLVQYGDPSKTSSVRCTIFPQDEIMHEIRFFNCDQNEIDCMLQSYENPEVVRPVHSDTDPV